MAVGDRYRWRCPRCGTIVAERVVESRRTTAAGDAVERARCGGCGCVEEGPAGRPSPSLATPDGWAVVEEPTKDWRRRPEPAKAAPARKRKAEPTAADEAAVAEAAQAAAPAAAKARAPRRAKATP